MRLSLCFCFYLLATFTYGRYLIEYTHEVVEPGIITLAICHDNPGCNTVYRRQSGLHLTKGGNIDDALKYIDLNGERGFQFVAMYNLTLVPMNLTLTGKRTVIKTIEVEATEDVLQWRPRVK